MKVYACTLVDDDPEYILGETLADAMQMAVPRNITAAIAVSGTAHPAAR